MKKLLWHQIYFYIRLLTRNVTSQKNMAGARQFLNKIRSFWDYILETCYKSSSGEFKCIGFRASRVLRFVFVPPKIQPMLLESYGIF
jgi:hypothetical protein